MSVASRGRDSVLRRLGAALGGGNSRDRLASLERAVRKLEERGRDHATTIEARLGEIARTLEEQPTGKDLREIRQALRSVSRQEPELRLFETLEGLASSGRPLLVGPWTGEVGFELLYWIPFLEWVRAQWPSIAERELVVSRGGVSSWYRRTVDEYADILSFFGPDEFRDAVSEERRKHRRPGVFDERVTAAVVRDRGLGEVDQLHPGLMYRAFAPYWAEDAGYALIDRFTRPRLLESPANTLPAGLPADYVAVRFYFSECFPATDENRSFARRVVASLAERSHVVVLSPGFSLDEHVDWAVDVRDRVVGIAQGLAPERNLAVQSAVIAGARAFVGTYGGYSYLAPLYKVPAVAFYSRPTFKQHHLYAAQRMFSRIEAAALLPVDVTQAPLVQAALGAVDAA